MNEFIEKLICRLEEAKEISEKEMEECIFKALPYHDSTEGKVIGIKNAIEIVNKLAEEYKNDFCEWRLCDEEANVYDTTCRNPHILIEGSPTDNNYEYCPYCGKKIKIAPYQPKGEYV